MRWSLHVFVFIAIVSFCGVGGFFIGDILANTTATNSWMSSSNDTMETARKKKKDRYTIPIILGALMVKGVILPLAFKAMAVMSSVAVLLSAMSLIVSSIVGYTKLAWSSTKPSVKIVHVNGGSWAKEDDFIKGFDYSPDSTAISEVINHNHGLHYDYVTSYLDPSHYYTR